MFEQITFYQVFGLPLIVYGGISTFIVFLAAASIPLFFEKKIKKSFLVHKTLAITALAMSLFHGILGILAFI